MRFAEVFKVLTGHAPLAWQAKLYSESFAKGAIPSALDIPTGLGKTSVIALWLIARALGDDAVRRALPRRLVYVVDRRAVVDQATAVAERLRIQLATDACSDLRKPLGVDGDAGLPISTLRGQFADNRAWLADPAATAIVVGTVDMVGSRLLFEGYGVSRRMRPVHAGLLGADALVALDEAHLVPPFARLLHDVERAAAGGAGVERHEQLGPRDARRRGIVPRFAVLPLSATLAAAADDAAENTRPPFRIEREDEDAITVRRLDAAKRLTLAPYPNDETDKTLAQRAFVLATADPPRRVVVFCDRREKAAGAFASAKGVLAAIDSLRKGDRKSGRAAVEIERRLFTGGQRVRERQRLADWLEAQGLSGESSYDGATRRHPAKPTILVATSAGEVGVDFDADDMVSDLVAFERMAQRLGRVNRRGAGDAAVCVFHAAEAPQRKKPKEPSSEERRAETAWAARTVMERMPVESCDGAAFRDASPRALKSLTGHACEDASLRTLIAAATTPAPLRPALSRPLVEAWAMTSLETHTGRPKVEPWLRGWEDEPEPQTTIVWRTHLPVLRDENGAPVAVTRKSLADVEAFLDAAAPHETEKLETETWRVAEWMTKRRQNPATATADAADAPGTDDDAVHAAVPPLDVAGFVLAADGSVEGRMESAHYVMPDRSISLSDKSAKDNVVRLLGGRTLIVDARLGGLDEDGLLDDSAGSAAPTADADDAWSADIGRRVVDTPGADGDWREVFAFPLSEGDEPRTLHVEVRQLANSNEEGRSLARAQTLSEHHAWTANAMRRIADALGLPEDLARALVVAARLHDEGKKAERWQRAFSAEAGRRDLNVGADVALAKTTGPFDRRHLDGYRHEFGSLFDVEADAEFLSLDTEHRALVLHLVAAHHGNARPTIATRGCTALPPPQLEARAAEVALRFARLQTAWGPWGLAWLEAMLRAADAEASRKNDEGGQSPAAAAARKDGSA